MQKKLDDRPCKKKWTGSGKCKVFYRPLKQKNCSGYEGNGRLRETKMYRDPVTERT